MRLSHQLPSKTWAPSLLRLAWEPWQPRGLGLRIAEHDYENIWVVVKELNLSYYVGETLLFTIYMCIYIYIPIMVT